MLFSIRCKYFDKKVIFLTFLHIWIHLLRYCVKISLMREIREKLHTKGLLCSFSIGSQQAASHGQRRIYILLYYVRENRLNRPCVAFVCGKGVIYCFCIYLRL